jgi:predicted RNA binding protein with dsRBD fold (UPF0201 family)
LSDSYLEAKDSAKGQFPDNFDLIVEAQVKRSESMEKVRDAILNLFPRGGEIRQDRGMVQFVSTSLDSLQRLKDQLRDRRVRAVARRLLQTNKHGEYSTETLLLLNKQAATVGIAALCEQPDESPLGPIIVRIRSSALDRVIDWLTEGYESSERS